MPSTSSEKNETNARTRDHNQGRQDRAYTSAQVAAVDRVRKCKSTNYYAILDIETTATETEVRKAYRKLALVMHPDKNGAPGADEAFKMVSKAFQVLSDPDKKRVYDQTGTDPESRSAAASGMNGFSGFGPGMARAGGPGGAGFSDDFADEIFRAFFGGGAGGDPFQTFGASFGPNIRFQTFGGPRRGPAGARPANGGNGVPQEPQDLMSNLVRLLPLLLLFITPLLSSLFDSSSSSGYVRNTRFEFTPSPPYTELRTTYQHNIPYFVNPSDVRSMSTGKLRQLDNRAELTYLRSLRDMCNREYEDRQQKIMDAQGWFSNDKEALEKAKKMKLPSCQKLDKLGIQY